MLENEDKTQAAEADDIDLDIDLDDIDLDGLNLDEDTDGAADEGAEALDETAAAETIKAKPSRASAMAAVVGAMGKMSGEELNHFAASIAKPENKVTDADFNKNRASITAKKVTKEEMEELFGDDLSEDFRDKTMTLFDAAVNTQVNLQVTEAAEALESAYEETLTSLEEAYATTLEEEVANLTDTLYENVDSYINHVAESWMEENKVAIDASLRASLAEDFMGKLKDMFLEHNLNIPDESEDVLAEMLEVNEAQDARIQELTEELIAVKAGKQQEEVSEAFDAATTGLAATTIDKIRTLAENIDFSNVDEYKKKLGIIKEHVTKKPTPSSGILVEEAPAVDPATLTESEKPAITDPRMAQYASAIHDQVKRTR